MRLQIIFYKEEGTIIKTESHIRFSEDIDEIEMKEISCICYMDKYFPAENFPDLNFYYCWYLDYEPNSFIQVNIPYLRSYKNIIYLDYMYYYDVINCSNEIAIVNKKYLLNLHSIGALNLYNITNNVHSNYEFDKAVYIKFQL